MPMASAQKPPSLCSLSVQGACAGQGTGALLGLLACLHACRTLAAQPASPAMEASEAPNAKARPYPSPAPSCCLAQCQRDTSWFIFRQGTLVPPVGLVQGPGGLTQPQPACTERHLLSTRPAAGTATEANWMVPVHLSN